MHRLTFIDAWILVGIYRAEPGGDSYYAEIISSLPDIDQPIPSHDEFSAAYNKFLYISFIVADGDKTTPSAAARQLVENARVANASDRIWVDNVYRQLSAYKLKSMCSRHVWTENQYIAAATVKKD